MTISFKKKGVQRRNSSDRNTQTDDVTHTRRPSTPTPPRSRRVGVVESSEDIVVTTGRNRRPSVSIRSNRGVSSGHTTTTESTGRPNTPSRSHRVVCSGDTAVVSVSKDDEDGYNSMDEHQESVKEDTVPSKTMSSVEENVRKEAIFESMLQETKGFVINRMSSDGACMFRAVADQIYGDQDMHSVVRQHCMDYMVKNEEFFSKYITENFTSYIIRKRFDHTFGNHVELHALSEMYNRNVEVYQYSCDPINTFSSRSQTDDVYPPIRLSYHANIHYNSIVDPINPSVGIGLGLPRGETVKDSDTLSIERSILDDRVKLTDREATDEELVANTAFESYKQWLIENEVPCTSTYEELSCDDIPSSCDTRKSCLARKSTPSLDPITELSGSHKRICREENESGEDDLMVAIAQSQLEYLDSLKNKNESEKKE